MLKLLASVAFGAVLVSTPAARLPPAPQAAAGAEATSAAAAARDRNRECGRSPGTCRRGARSPAERGDRRAQARRHRAAGAGGDRRQEAARRGGAGRPRRSDPVSEGDRHSARWCRRREPMSLDTMFDLASLTKVVATTTSVMMLVERGQLRLNDRVADFIPGFERYGKARHHHPPPADPHLGPAAGPGSRRGVDRQRHGDRAGDRGSARPTPPGQRFVYSDINFFLLGDIVRRVSGVTLDRFAKQEFFDPLGMKDTMFLPPAALRSRIAPTEAACRSSWPCEGAQTQMLRGVVHDPTARRMGGVAGHAGLFSTAADLAIFCRMLLGRRGVPRHPRPLAADGREDDQPGRSAPTRTSAVSAGTSTRRTRRTAASCCRSARSGTPASPARRCGSIRRPGCSSCSCRTACTRTARGTSRRCARASRPWRRRRS